MPELEPRLYDSLLTTYLAKRRMQQIAGHDDALHLAGAFADAADAQLTVPALEREFYCWKLDTEKP